MNSSVFLPTSFANGYTQERPFNIHIVGPSQQLCERLLSNYRTSLGESTCYDEVLDEHVDLPRPNNRVNVARHPRLSSEGRVRYTLFFEPYLLDPGTEHNARAHIDGYIIPFDDSSTTEFAAIDTYQMDRVVCMCNSDTWGPKKIIALVAHHGNPFSRDVGYKEDDMYALMARSNSAFWRTNLSNPTACAVIVDRVIEFMIRVHCTHQMNVKTDLAYRNYFSQTTTWRDLVDNVLNFPLRLFSTSCITTPTIDADNDPDQPRPWTRDEIELHKPGDLNRATPMGVEQYT